MGAASRGTAPLLTRRQAIAAAVGAVVAAPPATGLYAWGIEPHWLRVRRRDLPVAGLPPALAGRTLVQLSDLHVGPQVDAGYVTRALRRAAALDPDIVVCTGDWITYRGPGQFAELARVLAALPRGRLATVGILGNHDYGFGWRLTEVADRVAAVVADAGMRVLRNETHDVAGLTLIGLDDLWSPRFGPGPLLAAHGAGPAIALCHNPDAVDRPVWAGFRGWILAGHTHGGQCKPPFLPPPLLPVANRRYTAGEFALDDGRRLYINRGIGHLLRARFNVRPEITAFRLAAG